MVRLTLIFMVQDWVQH